MQVGLKKMPADTRGASEPVYFDIATCLEDRHLATWACAALCGALCQVQRTAETACVQVPKLFL